MKDKYRSSSLFWINSVAAAQCSPPVMAPYSTFILLFILSLQDSFLEINSQGIGINYGQIANNLPSPTKVAQLLQSIQVTRVKLYDADPNVLKAFAGSNVEFAIGLGNELLQAMASDSSQAQTWIQSNVQPYISQTNITCIVVGNEIFGNNSQLMPFVVPAMKAVYMGLKKLSLDDRVTVTTAHSTAILQNSFPPSACVFNPELVQYIEPLLDFQAQIKSPLLINAYPFFAYMADPKTISLEYVLFKPNAGSVDPTTNFHYDNMLYAQIDAVYAAMEKMGHTDVQVRISETGWPSKGDPNEIGASVENAAAYNGNLLQSISKGDGTPAKPHVPIDVYVFALFNENMKPGPLSERNYGLYFPNISAVYNLGWKEQQQQQQPRSPGSDSDDGGTSGYGYFPQFTISSSTPSNKKFMDLDIGFLSLMVTILMLLSS